MIQLKKGNGILWSFFVDGLFFFSMMFFSMAIANGVRSPLHVANCGAGSDYIFI